MTIRNKEKGGGMYQLDVECRNCKAIFPHDVKRGEKFGQANHYDAPLACPDCGVEECSRHAYYDYTFTNFKNKGLHQPSEGEAKKKGNEHLLP